MAAALLPWRRSKWVLVGPEERKRPGKGWAPRLSCASLLADLLGSCPELWPAGGPLGGLFRRRRRTAQLNAEEPTFRACYLGHAATLQATGEGCAEAAVEKLWARSQAGQRGARMQLSLGPRGLHLRPAGKAEEEGGRRPGGHAYLLHRITYCAADRRHPRVLAWVYRHPVKNKAVALRCHAVLLSRAEKAQAAARLLFQTSAAAFSEFKRLQRRSDSRRLQRQLLGEAGVPLAPLRRLLNAKCPYRPPPERGRNGTRLSAILEEEEEQEEGGGGRREEARKGKERPASCTPTRATYDWLATHTVLCAIGSFGPAGPPLWAGPGAPPPEAKRVARHLERPEIQTLVREFQVCSLRTGLPVGEAASWTPGPEPPCLSR